MDIRLELTNSAMPTWRVYKDIRKRHYVPDNGSQGRQLHYLVHYQEQVAGIISGGSATFSVKPVDKFFGLDLCKRFDAFYDEGDPIHPVMLGTIINNTVFRLENHAPNLASRVLSLWRKRVVSDWEQRFDDKLRLDSPAGRDVPIGVLGFETFIVPNAHRAGACYKADNWAQVGVTTSGKLIFCKRNPKFRDYLDLNGECLLSWEVALLLDEMYQEKAAGA